MSGEKKLEEMNQQLYVPEPSLRRLYDQRGVRVRTKPHSELGMQSASLIKFDSVNGGIKDGDLEQDHLISWYISFSVEDRPSVPRSDRILF